MHGDDDWPTEPVPASTYRLALRAEALPGQLSPAAVRPHRDVRRRLRELDAALDRCGNPALAGELRGATAGLRELLAGRFPLASPLARPAEPGSAGRHRGPVTSGAPRTPCRSTGTSPPDREASTGARQAGAGRPTVNP